MSTQVGVAILPYPQFLQSCLPLFEAGEIDVLEWPFDIFLNAEAIPEWMIALRDEYSKNNRLIGHGVYYSPFDAQWTRRQDAWINHLKKESSQAKFQHITEHFGLMSSNNAHRGCPMPVVFSERLLSIGTDRLKRLQDAAQAPVGLENLALAFSLNDVKEQGEFLEKLVDPVNGFIILDLHNLYCQSHNFKVTMEVLLQSYPLHLVKEIHISGGSWSEMHGATIRRDTHDHQVPQEVFEALEYALPKCPNVEYLILEQLNHSLSTEASQTQFQQDFRAIQTIAKKHSSNVPKASWGNHITPESEPLTDPQILEEQHYLKELFTNAENPEMVIQKLSELYPKRNWNNALIALGVHLAKKWS